MGCMTDVRRTSLNAEASSIATRPQRHRTIASASAKTQRARRHRKDIASGLQREPVGQPRLGAVTSRRGKVDRQTHTLADRPPHAAVRSYGTPTRPRQLQSRSQLPPIFFLKERTREFPPPKKRECRSRIAQAEPLCSEAQRAEAVGGRDEHSCSDRTHAVTVAAVEDRHRLRRHPRLRWPYLRLSALSAVPPMRCLR